MYYSLETDILISVIMPVYNTALSDIDRAVESVIRNGFQRFELIIVDDGSRQEIRDGLDRIGRIDNRISIIHQLNGGASKARNTGLNFARGEYVFFIDSDDYISTNSFEILYSAAIKVNADLLMGNVHRVEQSGVFIKDLSQNRKNAIWYKQDIDKIRLAMLERYHVQDDVIYFEMVDFPVQKLYRKSIILDNKLQFNPQLRSGEDRLFNYIYLKYCDLIYYTNECTYYYVNNTSSVTHRFSENLVKNTSRTLEFYKEAIESIDDASDRFIEAYYRRCIWAANTLLDNYYFHPMRHKKLMLNDYLHMMKADPYNTAVRKVKLGEIDRLSDKIEVMMAKRRLIVMSYFFKVPLVKKCFNRVYCLYDKLHG